MKDQRSAKPVADADVDILDAGVALGHEAERLLEQRALQTVHDKAVDLALHHDRRMAGERAEALRRARPSLASVHGAGTTSAAGMR